MYFAQTFCRAQVTLQRGADSVRQRLAKAEGASAIEYALLVGLIAVVIIVAVTALGGKVSDTMNAAAGSI